MNCFSFAKILTFAVIATSLVSCTHGSNSTKAERNLSRFTRQDLCCSATLSELGKGLWKAEGCGKSATYQQNGNNWTRVGAIGVGSGNPKDSVPECKQ